MKLKMERNNLMVEDAEIGFRNFAGVVGPYNKTGEKSFVILYNN